MAQVLADSLFRGCELALLAVGMTLVYSVVRFINIAHTDLATIGAYGVILVGSVVGGAFVFDAIASIVLTGLLTVVLYYAIVARLLRRGSASAMIGTLALSVVIRAVIHMAAGPEPQTLDVPLERGMTIAGAIVTPSQIRGMALSAVVMIGLLALLRATPLGTSIRAVSANRELAQAAGVNVKRVISMTWLIAGALAAFGGVIIGIDAGVHRDMGFNLLLPVFAVALLGGLGSVGGAIVAAFLLALVERLALDINFGSLIGGSDAFLPIEYQPAVGFLCVLLVLILRPQGLFGAVARRA